MRTFNSAQAASATLAQNSKLTPRMVLDRRNQNVTVVLPILRLRSRGYDALWLVQSGSLSARALVDTSAFAPNDPNFKAMFAASKSGRFCCKNHIEVVLAASAGFLRQRHAFLAARWLRSLVVDALELTTSTQGRLPTECNLAQRT